MALNKGITLSPREERDDAGRFDVDFHLLLHGILAYAFTWVLENPS